MLNKAGFADLYDILSFDSDAAEVSTGDASHDRAQVLSAAEIAESFLRNKGFKAGDVLCSWLPDSAAWLQLLLACVKLGVLLVPISPRSRQDEARRVLRTSRAKGVVVPASLMATRDVDAAESLAEDMPFLSHVIGVDVWAGFFAPSARSALTALAPMETYLSLCDLSAAA